MKRIPRKLAWTLGIIIGLLLVMFIGLRLFFPAEKVKEMAVSMASAKLGREITVGDVGLSFAGGLGVQLDDFTVANPSGFTGDPLLVADHVDLKVQIFPLLRGNFQVNRLVVDRPRVRLLNLGEGVNNYTFDSEEPKVDPGADPGRQGQGAAAEVAVSFDRLEIHGGHLTFRDDATGQGLDLAELNLAAGLTNPRPGVFQSSGLLKVDTLQVIGEKPLPAVNAVLDYDLSLDTTHRVFELGRGDLEIEGLPATLRGNLNTWPDSLRGSCEIRSEGLDLTDLLSFLTPEQQAPLEPFTFVGDLSVATDLDFDSVRDQPLEYEGQAMIAGLRVAGRDIAGDLGAREIRFEFQPDKLEIRSEGGTFADQPLSLTVSVEDFQDPRMEGSVNGTFDLAFVEPFFPPERQIALAGICEMESWFAGNADDIAAMDYAGRAVLREVSYRDPALPDALEQLAGTVRFDPDSVVVEKAEATFGAGDLTVSGVLVDHLPYFLPSEKENRDALPKPSFTFEARSRRIDIDKLFPAAAPGASASAGGGATILDTLSSESIGDLLGRGTFQADTLIYSRVPFTGVAGKVRLQDGILECFDVVAGVYGGSVTGVIAVDLNDLNDPGYRGDFEAVDIEANNFVNRFTALSQVVYGKAGLQGSFSARGRDPERVKSTLTMDSLAALTSGKVVTGDFVASSLGSLAAQVGQTFDQEQALKDLTTLVKVENGRVGLDQLKTRLGSFGDLTLSGSYGFTGDLEYKGAILLTKDQTARLYASGGLTGSVANLFGNQAERLSLPLSVAGTVTHPKMELDFTELTNNLRSQLEDEITDGLKDELDNKLKGLFGK